MNHKPLELEADPIKVTRNHALQAISHEPLPLNSKLMLPQTQNSAPQTTKLKKVGCRCLRTLTPKPSTLHQVTIRADTNWRELSARLASIFGEVVKLAFSQVIPRSLPPPSLARM